MAMQRPADKHLVPSCNTSGLNGFSGFGSVQHQVSNHVVK